MSRKTSIGYRRPLRFNRKIEPGRIGNPEGFVVKLENPRSSRIGAIAVSNELGEAAGEIREVFNNR